jgi:hypothetical protein
MASMNNQQRAQQYFERLIKASNPKSELERILEDLNSLVFNSNKEPIDSATKRAILEELESLARRKIALEDTNESRNFGYIEKSKSLSNNASDNSDILDVISAMKKRVG